jgi:hypothetical protein
MTSRTDLPSSLIDTPDSGLPALTRLEEYEIECVISHSSFAMVYRGFDHALNLQVAIKEYLPDALARRGAELQVVLRSSEYAEAFERGMQAFIDEAQALAHCAHPALLQVSRIPRYNGTAYRVMPYGPGPTLLEQRRSLGSMPDAHVLRAWFDDLLGALQVLHDAGFVHGAVAPDNILLLDGDRPLLMGLNAVPAALISDRTQSMMAALGPSFEPIEQRAPLSFMVTGPWTDLYSLAATLHYCISGQLPSPPAAASAAPPFEPLGEVWRRLHAEQPARDAEPAWFQVLDACLCEGPQDRPQSVAQVREMLDARAPAVLRATPPAGIAPVVTPRPQAADAAPGEAAGEARAVPEASSAALAARVFGRRLWLMIAAAVIMLAAMLALFAGSMKKPSGGAAQTSARSGNPLVETSPSEGPSANPAAIPTTPAAAPAPTQRANDADGAATSMPAATTVPAPAGPATKAPAKAAVATAQPAARMPPSPRQLCAGLDRYQLLKCMQTQCAKRAWAKHEQCVRLRTENKIS